jgi:lipoprotein NlpI/uncharacterized protein YoxC
VERPFSENKQQIKCITISNFVSVSCSLIMKKYSWLNALENVSLVGLGAGSIASLLLQQIFYTTAPLSILVVLGIANRRRLAQIHERHNTTLSETDQYLALQVDRLHHQVVNLPTPETINRLNRNLLFKHQELTDKFNADLNNLKQGLHQRVAAVEQQGVVPLRQEVRQLGDRCGHLLESLNQLGQEVGNISGQLRENSVYHTVEQLKLEVETLRTNLESLSHQTKPNLTTLQEQITRLDRQFSKLPPPVDLTSLKAEVGELIKIAADLVPRRDFTSLISEMQTLHQQQDTLKQSIVAIETAALNFKRSFNELPKPVDSSLHSATPRTDAHRDRISGFGRESTDGYDSSAGTIASVYPELQELAAHHLGHLWSQLHSIQEYTGSLAQQQRQLRDQLNQMPQTLDVVALQRQLLELSQRIPMSEGAIETFKARMQDAFEQELQHINQQLQSLPATNQSQLIFDFAATETDLETTTGSRAVLEQALESTQHRLIMIWPWAAQCRFDDALFRKFEAFLSRRGYLDLGWCYLADRQKDRWLSKMQRGWMSEVSQRNLLQETLHKLLQLKRRYPDQFQFKILGTSENFLVSDQSFAVLGITNALQTTTPFPTLQLKLKTMDTGVVQRLIQRFDHSELATDDLTAHWNRAITRYDLGDKAGAIADFTHILGIYPDDAVTYNARGLAHYDLNNWTSAITDFTEAIQIDPQYAASYCNRGFIQAEQGNYESAIADYTSAIEATPQYAVAYFYRGMAQQKLENYSAAIVDYSEAIQAAPDSPVAYYHRGLTWQKLGNLREAIADFELAAQFFWVRGSKTNAQKALANIAKLRQDLYCHSHAELAAEPYPV